jgi:hypothetical protein
MALAIATHRVRIRTNRRRYAVVATGLGTPQDQLKGRQDFLGEGLITLPSFLRPPGARLAARSRLAAASWQPRDRAPTVDVPSLDAPFLGTDDTTAPTE